MTNLANFLHCYQVKNSIFKPAFSIPIFDHNAFFLTLINELNLETKKSSYIYDKVDLFDSVDLSMFQIIWHVVYIRYYYSSLRTINLPEEAYIESRRRARI